MMERVFQVSSWILTYAISLLDVIAALVVWICKNKRYNNTIIIAICQPSRLPKQTTTNYSSGNAKVNLTGYTTLNKPSTPKMTRAMPMRSPMRFACFSCVEEDSILKTCRFTLSCCLTIKLRNNIIMIPKKTMTILATIIPSSYACLSF